MTEQPFCEAKEPSFARIDLHLHLDGSLSLSTVRELERLRGKTLTESEEVLRKRLQVEDSCGDLNEYLKKFAYPVSLLQTESALEFAAYRLLEELKAQGLFYAELRFAPQKHGEEGLSQKEAVEAVLKGMAKSDLPSSLILCCMRGEDNHRENRETAELAKEFIHHGVGAVDLAGAEALYPTHHFAQLFSFLREEKVPFTVHAGEADGPQSVACALDFGAKRIGHGVRAVEDPCLLDRLAREGVTLELCPTSNMDTGLFSQPSEFPLRTLLDAGVKVSLNTDNRTVSRTDLKQEFCRMAASHALSLEEQRMLAKNAALASFADEKTKAELLRKISSL